MSYTQRGPLDAGELFDSDARMDTRGFTPTATFVTKNRLHDVVWKPWMPTYGLERLNTKLLEQDKVWVDGQGHVWTLDQLTDAHLERLIAWLEGGRNYLKQYRSAKVIRSPMHVALCAERQKRWLKTKEKQDKAISENLKEMDRVSFEHDILPRLRELLREFGYKVVNDA